MPGRLITLTTDFGVRDSFVGVMKGVILGICPDARLVDLTHEIDPQDVQGAQLALESAVGFFPPGTIHLAVVDPGVGARGGRWRWSREGSDSSAPTTVSSPSPSRIPPGRR